MNRESEEKRPTAVAAAAGRRAPVNASATSEANKAPTQPSSTAFVVKRTGGGKRTYTRAYRTFWTARHAAERALAQGRDVTLLRRPPSRVLGEWKAWGDES